MIYTFQSSVISTRRSPPGICTSILFSVNPNLYATAAAAHAPVPVAIVYPAPRSYVSIAILLRSVTFIISVFTRSGKYLARSECTPILQTNSFEISCIGITQCGFPTDTHVAGYRLLPNTISSLMTSLLSPITGISSLTNDNFPIEIRSLLPSSFRYVTSTIPPSVINS